MSTRCQLAFGNKYNPREALIYRHSDGYPESVLPDMERFFDEVEKQCGNGGMGGTRFNDPSYLTAKFVVWMAAEFTRDSNAPLDFISLGIDNEIHGDIEYLYFVDCSDGDRPSITYQEDGEWEK